MRITTNCHRAPSSFITVLPAASCKCSQTLSPQSLSHHHTPRLDKPGYPPGLLSVSQSFWNFLVKFPLLSLGSPWRGLPSPGQIPALKIADWRGLLGLDTQEGALGTHSLSGPSSRTAAKVAWMIGLPSPNSTLATTPVSYSTTILKAGPIAPHVTLLIARWPLSSVASHTYPTKPSP